MADADQRDRLFDHEYDGIREYDNPMPRWWLAIFALSVLVCFPYALYYHFGPGNSVHDDLEAEMAAYAEQLLVTYGELKATPQTILAYMDDDVAMAGMAGLFKGKCAQCHLADGSGQTGPNLTDDAWINVRELPDIARVLEQGVVVKGMPAWSDKFTETQIVLLASYVARLSRNPVAGGKPPQGEPVGAWRVTPGSD